MTHNPHIKEENSSVRKADESVRDHDMLLEVQIYEIIDSFLVEAKDQHGNERSIERLNADRHLAAEALLKLFSAKIHTERAEIQQDINSVLAMLDGDTDRVKIANYVRKYLLNNNAQ